MSFEFNVGWFCRLVRGDTNQGGGSLLTAIIFGAVLLGCSAQRNFQSDDIDISRIMEAEGITFWFDVYDPISYAVNFNDDVLRIVFYTHHLKNNKVISEEHASTDKASLVLFRKLSLDYYKKCETLPGFICFGLDGSEIWVQFEIDEEIIVRKYWSPEDQLTTELGIHLNNFQNELSRNLNIDQLRKAFMSKLNEGKYWNYGGTQINK